MKIEQFATITQNVIREQGFHGLQPTVCFPERRDIRALAGVPETEAHEPIALRWAAGLAKAGEEYLVAFKHSATEFKVVHISSSSQEHQVYAAEAPITVTGSNFAEDAKPDEPTDEEIARIQASSPEERAGVEAMVLAECTPRWQKIAKIVGTLMNEFEQAYPHLPFAMLQATMEKLEELGKVEIDGDPWAMRESEMRLAGPSSSRDA